MKLRFSILFILGLVLVSACLQKPISKTTTTVKETTTKNQVVRDTVFQIEKSNAELIASIEALKNAKQPIVYKNDRASISVEYRHDTIFAECQCDSVAIKAQLFDSFVKTIIERDTETITTKFKRQPFFKQLGIGIFVLLILAFLVGLVFVIIKVIKL